MKKHLLILCTVILLGVLIFFLPALTTSEEENSGYVTFWFDDGLLSTYEKAFPVLEEKGWDGVLAVVGSRSVMSEKVQLENDSVMTWENVKELQDAGWEISSHSMTHEKLTKLEDESYLKMEIVESKEVLENYGFDVNSFTFPHGAKKGDKIQDLVEDNYLYWRSTVSEINSIPPDRHLKTFFVTECADKEEIEKWIKKAEKEEKWLIIVLHSIIDHPVGWWQQTPEQFMMIVDAVEKSSLEVVLPRDIFAKFKDEIQ